MQPSEVKKTCTVKWPVSREKLESIHFVSSFPKERRQSMYIGRKELRDLQDQIIEVTDVYRDKGFCNLLPNSLVDPKLAQVKLELWANTDSNQNLRGLERYVNDKHRKLRDSTTRKAIQAVLDTQRKVREQEENVDFDEHLALASMELSSESILFAQMIAKADEKTAQKISRTSCIRGHGKVPLPRRGRRHSKAIKYNITAF